MPLTLNGTTGIAGVDGSASTPSVQGSDTNTGVFYPAADTVAIGTGGSERMRIDSSGRVGIGTSTPGAGYSLTVNGSTIVGNGTDITPTASWGGQLTINGSGYSGGLAMDASGIWLGNNSASRAVIFATDETERMRINSSGNVGIGTSSPSTALHVVGEITATQGVTGYATFNAAAPGTQTVTTGVYTKATLTTVLFNVGGNFASSTFTPTVAGYYQINGICGTTAGTSITYTGVAIYKNGSAESVVLCPGYSSTSGLVSISDIIYCNGTTDYIELYVRPSGTGTLTVNTNTAMSGCLVRGA